MLYPSNIKKEYKKPISYANRGMDLELLINETNKYYLANSIAVIYKKPTPIGISNVKYTKTKTITTGYLKSKSTLDYVGLYKGKYLDFDAKSTKSKTSFALSNIHSHQIDHIRNVLKHQGICFLIIDMNNLVYYLKGEDLITFIDSNSRSSIPYDYIRKKGFVIKIGINPLLDYLSIIDKLYF